MEITESIIPMRGAVIEVSKTKEIPHIYHGDKEQRSLEITILAHRYLYYCLARPVISDYTYDMTCKDARTKFPHSQVLLSMGSDNAADYPIEAIQLAHRMC
jgi:NAD-dependent DNA ligase